MRPVPVVPTGSVNDIPAAWPVARHPLRSALLGVKVYLPNYPISTEDCREDQGFTRSRACENTSSASRQEEQHIKTPTVCVGWAEMAPC